jgi:hypothetical protein
MKPVCKKGVDYDIHDNNYKYLSAIDINKAQFFAKITLYCHILEKLISMNNRYINEKIINTLNRYYDNKEFKKIEYLDPYISVPSDDKIMNIKFKLNKILHEFLKY